MTGILKTHLVDIAPERLHAFHALASRWVSDTTDKISEPAEELDDWQAELIAQDNEMLVWFAETATELAGAALAVCITAYVEESFKTLWRAAAHHIASCAEHPLPQKPGWDDICMAWSKAVSESPESLPHYSEVKTIRLIANSFKHNDSFPKPDLAELLAIPKDKKLEFHKLVGHGQVTEAKLYVEAAYDSLAALGLQDF